MGNRKGKAGDIIALKSVAMVFLLIGLLMLVAFIYLIVNNRILDKKCETTKAEVLGVMNYIDTEGPHGKRVVANYIYDGDLCVYLMPSYYSFFIKKDQTIEVYIDPDDYKSAHLKTGIAACAPLGILGIVCTTIGVVLRKHSGSRSSE